MKRKILITCALPYANGPLHFGHLAGAYLPGDCYARFQKLQGHDVLFICGSDEYGVAITLSAEQAGCSPQAHVDKYHAINRQFFRELQICFDHYSRTTWSGHVATVQQFFIDLQDNGYIEERITDQLYSEAEQRFLADRYVVGTCPRCHFPEARGDECGACGASFEALDLRQPRSKMTGSPLVKRATKHWFLRFDLFREQLTTWLASKKWKSNVVHFAQNYIEELRPRAITRDGTWGVPLPIPRTEDKVFYVWFDAPIGYISAVKDWAELQGIPEAWKDYWLDPSTHYVQFIGKDNIPFHAIFFPAMIMGQNISYKLVDELPANEFYNLEGRQFSKSEGWVIDLHSFFEHFTTDQIRYVIAANAPETQDSSFSWKDFQQRCNSELLGKYGNFAHRVLTFTANACEGKIPCPMHWESEDKHFLSSIASLVEALREAYESFQLRRSTSLIMEIASEGNRYFDALKPWSLRKDPSCHDRLHTVIFCSLECIKAMALVSFPIIPNSAEKLWHLLGYANNLKNQNWDQVMQQPLPSGQLLPLPTHLFIKVEDELIDQEIFKPSSLKL